MYSTFCGCNVKQGKLTVTEPKITRQYHIHLGEGGDGFCVFIYDGTVPEMPYLVTKLFWHLVP